MKINVQVFHSIGHPQICQQFAEGHLQVLASYGVTQVTTARTEWFFDPGVYMICAFNQENNEMVAGVRIHIKDALGGALLPFEQGVGKVDKRVFGLVSQFAMNGPTAEICALWNAKETHGLGLGSYILMRAGIAFSYLTGIKTLFALCAPHTYDISVEKGFTRLGRLGKNGEFNYPKLDLIATALILEDLKNLPYAIERESAIIKSLREDFVCERHDLTRKYKVEVKYDLRLESVSQIAI